MSVQYLNFDIDAFDYEKDIGGERFSVRVAESPGGQQKIGSAEQVTFPAGLRDQLRRLERRSLDLGETIALGQQLADLLLPTRTRWMLDRSRAMLDPGQGLRIRLRLDSSALSDLPWEYLYIPGPDTPPDQRGPEGFLVRDRRVSLVRYELISQAVESLDPVGAGLLRLVALLADPKTVEYPALHLEAERQNIEKAVSKVPGIEVQFFPKGRVIDLEEAVTTGAHIFHFAGHGDFVTEMGTDFSTEVGRGGLVLIGEDGEPVLFPVEKLIPNLVGRRIRLAVFGACKTGRRDGVNAWTGVAPALTRAGIPAVVAMQYTIKDDNAIAFSRRFYAALAAGETIDAAVTDGRLAICNRSSTDERDWGVPVLYLRTPGGVLFPRPEREPEPPPPTSQPRVATAAERRALRDLMVNAFDEEGLELLCEDVQLLLENAGIELDQEANLETVGGKTKTAMVMNLIDFFRRRGYLDYLVQAVRNARPSMIQ